MNRCVIVYRVNGGRVQFVPDTDDSPFEFRNRDEAIAYGTANQLFDSGQADWQLVELDEI